MIQQKRSGCCVLLFWLISLMVLVSVPAHAQTEAQTQESTPDEKKPETPLIEAPAESETPAPLPIDVPSESDTGIRKEIQSLRTALNERREALAQAIERQEYANARLEILDAEFKSLELRLETAGLDLTENYARLLRQRLERLEQQHVADNLEPVIKERLEAARIEQFRLEEIGAVISPRLDIDRRLIDERARLLEGLREAVSAHIETLTTYFQTINTLQERIVVYQALVRQRLFWLPSTEPFSKKTFRQLFAGVTWLFEPGHWQEIVKAAPTSLIARLPWVVFLSLVLVILLWSRRWVKARLLASGDFVGNVNRDRIGLTLSALVDSLFLALPGVIILVLAALILTKSGDFGEALSKGLINAAFLFLLLGLVQQVARTGGVGHRHFNWRDKTLKAVRRGIPRLLVVLVPSAVLAELTESAVGTEYNSSLGRLIFTLASLALAVFAHRLLSAVRMGSTRLRTSNTYKLIHGAAIATPLIFAGISLFGYHYTAVQLEGSLFISICWLVALALVHYLSLRGLSVRERRIKLVRLREQRKNERKLAETWEAAESSGEGRPTKLNPPEIDMHDINTHTTALLKLVTLTIAVAGLWWLWSPVIPALRFFNEITLWSVANGADEIAVTLGDLGLALLFAAATVLAARNLPGTLEVMILSRMRLAPGSGYAITTVVTYLIVIIGVIVSLGALGAQWSKLQWLIAALGVGLGFGLQEIVANFVSGIILLFERPIRVGDTVTIGGITGTVSRIRIRATTLVDWDRKEQIIPNKTFVTQDLTNWTLSDSITRVIVTVGVAYGSDVDEVQELLINLVKDNSRVVDEPAPAVFCVGFGDSRIDFELRVFVKDILDIMPLSHELHASITRGLREAGIEIPFPQRDIHVRTNPGPPLADEE